jgi:hypothetical protein
VIYPLFFSSHDIVFPDAQVTGYCFDSRLASP